MELRQTAECPPAMKAFTATALYIILFIFYVNTHNDYFGLSTTIFFSSCCDFESCFSLMLFDAKTTKPSGCLMSKFSIFIYFVVIIIFITLFVVVNLRKDRKK